MREQAKLARVSYFEEAINKIIEIHRKKAADYTDNREFGNFEESASSADISVLQAIEVLIATKESRIRNLQKKGANPVNEPLEDSYYDRAVYAVISYARYLYEKESGKGRELPSIEGLRPIEKAPQPAGELLCARCGHGKSRHFPYNTKTNTAWCPCCYAHLSIERNANEIANTCFLDPRDNG